MYPFPPYVTPHSPHVSAFNSMFRLGRVGEDEAPFPPSFWRGLDVVINALDNVAARLYVDKQCVLHEKPLLESKKIIFLSFPKCLTPIFAISQKLIPQVRTPREASP